MLGCLHLVDLTLDDIGDKVGDGLGVDDIKDSHGDAVGADDLVGVITGVGLPTAGTGDGNAGTASISFCSVFLTRGDS